MMVLVAAITVLVLSLTWNDHGIPIVTLCDAAPLPYNKDFGTASVVYSSGIAEKSVEVWKRLFFMYRHTDVTISLVVNLIDFRICL